MKENISKKDVVLDLGCGTGRTIKVISPLCKEVIGIDNDENAVKDGKQKINGLKNAKIFSEDAEKTSFQDNLFDVVFIGMTFVNFGETKFRILKEVKRILKNNGAFIFSIYNEDSLEERLRIYNKYEYRKILVDNNGNITFDSEAVSEKFSKEEITKILESVGFKVTKIIKGKIFYLIKASK